MPLYTYRCEAGHEWEWMQDVEGSDVSEFPCYACSVDPMLRDRADRQSIHGKKVPSRPNVAFRGTGWTPTYNPGWKENKC